MNTFEIPTTLKKLETAIDDSVKPDVPQKGKTRPQKSRVRETETARELFIEKEPQTADDWFREKLKSPTKYTMTSDGNLLTPKGKVIELNPKVIGTPEYTKNQFDERNQKKREAEQSYITAKRELHEIIHTYKNSAKTDTDAAIVMIANQKVHDAECILNSIGKENRYIYTIEGLRENELHTEDPYNTSKIADDVVAGEYSTFHWKYFFMDKPQETVPEQIPEDDEDQQGGGQQNEVKKEKTPEEKARIWAIIRAKKAKAAASFK